MTYQEANALPVIATATRPDGYFGARCEVRLALHDQRILEIHDSGFYTCPAVTHADSAAEVLWLLENHPNFGKYQVIA